ETRQAGFLDVRVVDFGASLGEPHAGLLRQLGDRRRRQLTRGGESRRQHFVVERREFLIGLCRAADERARGGVVGLGGFQRRGGLLRARRGAARFHAERIHDERVHADVHQQRQRERSDRRAFFDENAFPEHHCCPVVPPAAAWLGT